MAGAGLDTASSTTAATLPAAPSRTTLTPLWQPGRHAARVVQELELGRSGRVHAQDESRAAHRIRESQQRRLGSVATDEYARCGLNDTIPNRLREQLQRFGLRRPVGELSDRVDLVRDFDDRAVRPVTERQPSLPIPVLVRVVEDDDLILVELIERHVRAGGVLPVRTALSVQRQATILGAFVVEEDDAGPIAAGIPERLALVDRPDGPRTIRDHHPELAVRLDDVDALDVDLPELLLLRLPDERGDRHEHDQRRRSDRVSLQEANVLVSGVH